jgi:hypothetical protein
MAIPLADSHFRQNFLPIAIDGAAVSIVLGK